MEEPSFLKARNLRLLVFGGKGGVGKTTAATATALKFAEASPEKPLLLVSTDPAHSLADSLGGCEPPNNLEVLEINAQEYLVAFKTKNGHLLRKIALRGTFLDSDDINQFLDLSLPGMDELMAFLEICRWVEGGKFECIIVDTAPSGHTLRLLAMPRQIFKWLEVLNLLVAKHRYMKKVFGKSSRDEVDLFIEGMMASVVQMEKLLHDPKRCRFVPIMLAEVLSIRETEMLVAELEHLEVPIKDVVINRFHPANACPVCAQKRRRQTDELKTLLRQSKLSSYELWTAPLFPEEMRGPKSLDSFWKNVQPIDRSEPSPGSSATTGESPRVNTPAWLPAPEVALLFFAGKGGVGKTTLACATAVRLANDFPDRKILLFSTDPAHSLSTCLAIPVGPVPTPVYQGLKAMEIDSQSEFDRLKKEYSEEVQKFLTTLLPNVDLTFDREVMKRILDLSPPGLDEVMAINSVIDFLHKHEYDIIIIDSAPTGHLIRLLEMPQLIDSWLKAFFGLCLKYKDVFRLSKTSQHFVEMSKQLKYLRTLLADPSQASIYAVTILTEMAFQETKDLLEVCDRMKISVPVLFLNLATPPDKCSFCSALNTRESAIRQKFSSAFPDRHHTLIGCGEQPQGLIPLNKLGKALYQARKNTPAGKSSVGQYAGRRAVVCQNR